MIKHNAFALHLSQLHTDAVSLKASSLWQTVSDYDLQAMAMKEMVAMMPTTPLRNKKCPGRITFD